MLKKIVLISILLGNFSKINKRPVPNKDVLGGKLLKNNKNVLDYYSAHQSKYPPLHNCARTYFSLLFFFTPHTYYLHSLRF